MGSHLRAVQVLLGKGGSARPHGSHSGVGADLCRF